MRFFLFGVLLSSLFSSSAASWLSKMTGIDININKVTGINIEGAMKKAVNDVLNIPKTREENGVEAVEFKPLVVDTPSVTFQQGILTATTVEDLEAKLASLGMNNAAFIAKFAEIFYSAKAAEQSFFIPAAGNQANEATAILIGVRTAKRKDGVIDASWLALKATSKVSATSVVHWRKVVRQFGNNRESKSQQDVARGLSVEEVTLIADTLRNAIYGDSRLGQLPGVRMPIVEDDSEGEGISVEL